MTRDPSDGSVREGCIPCEAGEKPHSDGMHRSLGHETECVADRFGSGLPLESTKDKAKLEKSRAWLKNYHGSGE